MRWHRKHALPEYTALLQKLGEAINRDGAVTEDTVARLRTESHKLYELTMTPMIRPAAHVLSTLDSRQIANLDKKFADKNREEREKLLADSEQEMLALRAERHVEFVEQLAGRLSAAQKKAITELSLHIPFATRHYIEQREAKQAGLIALLNAGAGEEQIAALLRQWISAPETSRSAQQQQAIAAYENAMNGMTVRIFELLSVRQKQRLSEKVAGYIGDFQQLAAQNDTELAAYELPRAQ